jgi:RNase H-fold protein (predicted Holliday junction resolvase)
VPGRRRRHADDLAAAVILQAYLDARATAATEDAL